MRHYVPSSDAEDDDGKKGDEEDEDNAGMSGGRQSERKVTLIRRSIDWFVDVPPVKVFGIVATGQRNVPCWVVVADDVGSPVASTILVSASELGRFGPYQLREMPCVFSETWVIPVVVFDFVEPCSNGTGAFEVVAPGQVLSVGVARVFEIGTTLVLIGVVLCNLSDVVVPGQRRCVLHQSSEVVVLCQVCVGKVERRWRCWD